jgi:NAD(P)-dependent dehydrogenase (short-subunit alcohol dehydrogenase family)
MVEQGGGSIINIASTAAIEAALPGQLTRPPKHALVGLTRNTAWMYAQRDVRCNAISPWRHEDHRRVDASERIDSAGAARTRAYAALIPAALDPEDIAVLALFLASDESRYVNGAIIPADAGWTAA